MKKLILLLGIFAFFSCQESGPKKFVCATCEESIKREQSDSNSYKPSANGIDGEALFKANCAACHYASDKKSIGPGLRGSYARIPGGNWKYDFIHDSQKLIKSGDAYANAIYKEYGNASMVSFPHLTNEEIDEILRYCNN